jgi:cytochrome c-type biogenesis protein CcmH/NrfG
MKAETIAVATATAFFGLIVGWVIGSQQARTSSAAPPAAVTAAAPAQPAPSAPPAPSTPPPKLVDEATAQALKNTADRDPRNAAVRTQLGNLYFDADRFDEAIRWYQESLKVEPKNPDVSTDLAVAFYYLNQPDRALKQFEYSLTVDPKHTKTMLNMGIVRAFGKQDLTGAVEIWQKLIAMAPGSADALAARKALDGLKAAHPEIGGAATTPRTGAGG